MSQTVQFVPSSTQVFAFTPKIAGTLYNATVPYSIFGQRYYLTITDQNSNLVLQRSVTSSGPQLQAQLTWVPPSTAYITTQVAHNVPIGASADVNVSGTGTAFDGVWQVLAVTATVLTYRLPNPAQSAALPGIVVLQPVNLVGGVITGGWLVFDASSMQFAFES